MQEEKQYQDLFYLVEDLKDARKDPMHFLQAIHQNLVRALFIMKP